MLSRIRSWTASSGSKSSPESGADEETYRYSPEGDSKLRKTILRQLFSYGISEENPQVEQADISDLLGLAPRLAAEFWTIERRWIDSNLTPDEQHGLRQSIADHGIGTSYDQPLVRRPMDYSTIAGHSVNSLETAWKLVDRGIEVARTAMDRHFCYLAGLRAGNLFFDAGNPYLEQKRLSYASALRGNREAAVKDFIKQWDESPPGLGQEYDYLEFTQAVNRISVPYRDRDKVVDALEQSIAACNDMISRTEEFKALFVELGQELPSKHHGYYQLAVIHDKHERWDEAIKVCSQAIKEGWPGDWEVRIARYKKKLHIQHKSINAIER